jgi:phenylalanyl-tRNA synthetase alpha chain
MLMAKLAEIKKSAFKDVKEAGNLEALENLRVKYLGRRGALTAILKSLKDLGEKEKREIGGGANEFKKELEDLIGRKSGDLKKAALIEAGPGKIDITRPGFKAERGSLHPLTRVRAEIENIFEGMGFSVIEGPEAEAEYYNFDALNIPPNHPARDMWDTFWLKGPKASRLLLRTHTSPVEARYMETHQPPFRIISPGRVFRHEATDASHDIQFYQIEGLMVGKTVSVADFKGVISEFFKKLFTREVSIRLRPSFFSFVEPGFEVDVSCVKCAGRGCNVCGGAGWLEIMGAGMTHPNVFKAAGYDPAGWQGFAFGLGLDRVAMIKYGIDDIRLFYQNDLRFLRQFS